MVYLRAFKCGTVHLRRIFVGQELTKATYRLKGIPKGTQLYEGEFRNGADLHLHSGNSRHLYLRLE